MELEKEPGKALPAGFPHTMYLSDAHNQMLSSSLSQKNKRYGAGLPPPEESFVDYGRIMNYDKRQGESRWASITSTEFVTPSEANEKVIFIPVTCVRLIAPPPDRWRSTNTPNIRGGFYGKGLLGFLRLEVVLSDRFDAMTKFLVSFFSKT
ncbi:unnamed protein product [Ascophyllum nodosum]